MQFKKQITRISGFGHVARHAEDLVLKVWLGHFQTSHLAVKGDCWRSCSDGDAACAATHTVPSSWTTEVNTCWWSHSYDGHAQWPQTPTLCTLCLTKHLRAQAQ